MGLFKRKKGCLAARPYSMTSGFPEHLASHGAGESGEGFLTCNLLLLIISGRGTPNCASNFHSCLSPKEVWGRFYLSLRAFSGLNHFGELENLGSTFL